MSAYVLIHEIELEEGQNLECGVEKPPHSHAMSCESLVWIVAIKPLARIYNIVV